MPKHLIVTATLVFCTLSPVLAGDITVQLGPRPFFLVDDMKDGELKSKLDACKAGPFEKSAWSIGHRGAPLQFPEHTKQSYMAAARMGAGILECDVTFTRDRQLVCRHSQNDLHTTTNILQTDLAKACTAGFSPASDGKDATAECRTSDITLAQFKTLNGKMDAANKNAKTVDDYVNGTARWRTDLYATNGTVLSHAESIELFKSLNVKFTPELKSPSVEMPYQGEYTQAMYAQNLIDEYKKAGVSPEDVFAQSFSLQDILYWIEHEPEFGRQAVYLDGSFFIKDWSPADPTTWQHSMVELKEMGVNYIAPPIWALVTLDERNIEPSAYARQAKAAGLKILTWTAERYGFLKDGGGWYYQSIADITNIAGDVFELMHVLHQDVGIAGLFSDWPATTTYYANCFGLK